MNTFQPILEKFRQRKILVLGDVILDAYITGSSDKLCREAPVPVIQVEQSRYSCGGAAHTAINVHALGGEAVLLSVVGKDDAGRRLRRELTARGLNTDNILLDPERVTISKQRICAFANILLRLDAGATGAPGAAVAGLYAHRLGELYRQCDAVIVSDYGYGLISDSVIRLLRELRNQRDIPLIVDARDLLKFSALEPTVVKPNYDELVELLRLPRLKAGRRDQVKPRGYSLLALTGARYAVATLDEEGSILFERGHAPRLVASAPVTVRSTIGAGDTFVSALTLALCSGSGAETAVRVGSGAAAIALEKAGTGVCTHGELQCYFNGNRKFMDGLPALRSRILELKEEGRRIVFTNGCFDILHKGHVNFLRQARAAGDILVVALNTDAGIRQLKGPDRPINTLEDRIEVLSGLACVDYLISFDGESPDAILRALQPDLFVKGATYTAASLPEARLLREIGCELRIIPFIEDFTTENLLARIREPAALNAGREAF